MELAIIIWSICSVFFVVIGVVCFFYKKPMPFWNIQYKLEVSNVKKYNRAVGILWLGFAVIFEILGLLLMKGMPWAILSIIGTLWCTILAMAVYTRIEKKYRI